jgi:predicted transposase/invertase (TIGR01784 family)
MRLDRTLDVVFKLFFSRSPELLCPMLEAVLGEPIASVRVLNPGILGETFNQKAVILDIRVELLNRKRVDVEMQVRAHPAFPERLLYYGALDYGEQLDRQISG